MFCCTLLSHNSIVYTNTFSNIVFFSCVAPSDGLAWRGKCSNESRRRVSSGRLYYVGLFSSSCAISNAIFTGLPHGNFKNTFAHTVGARVRESGWNNGCVTLVQDAKKHDEKQYNKQNYRTKQESKQQLNLQVTFMQFITITSIFYNGVKGARHVCTARSNSLCVYVCASMCMSWVRVRVEWVNESLCMLEHCASAFVYGDDVEWYILFDCYITYSLVFPTPILVAYSLSIVSHLLFSVLFFSLFVYIFLFMRSHFIFISAI